MNVREKPFQQLLSDLSALQTSLAPSASRSTPDVDIREYLKKEISHMNSIDSLYVNISNAIKKLKVVP